MRRFRLDSLCRQLLSSRDPSTPCHWLSDRSGPRSDRYFSIFTPIISQKASEATAAPVNTGTSVISAPGLRLREPWENDVTEREVTTVCPVTSPNMNDVTPKKRQQATLSPNSNAKSNPTVPPYLAFDTARPFEEMPAPFSLPVIGTLWMRLPGGPLHGLDLEQGIVRLQELYGPIIMERVMLGFSMVHAYRPEDIEAVYRVQGHLPVRESFRTLHKYNALYNDGIQGLVSSNGEDWYHLRSQVQRKMLRPKAASAYLELHTQVSQDWVAALDRLRDPEDGVIEDLLPEIYKFALEGIGCLCFNRRLGALEADIPADSDTYRFIQAASDVFELTQMETKQIFVFRNSAVFKKLVHAMNFIRQFSAKETLRTLQDFSGAGREADGESGDLIPYLITKTGLTEQEVNTLISEFVFAGIDTTSHFIGFALYGLATNPDVQEKLIQEIDHFVPGNDVISANTLGRMSYLKGVAKETHRLMPVTPGNARTLTRDVVLSGYHVPAGTFIALHHPWANKSQQYVRDPDRFEPERWLRGNTSPQNQLHPFSLLPFGFGSRSCVGRRFAEQEFALALIKIFQKYRVEYAHTEELRYDASLVNKPITPLKFRFLPRGK